MIKTNKWMIDRDHQVYEETKGKNIYLKQKLNTISSIFLLLFSD